MMEHGLERIVEEVYEEMFEEILSKYLKERTDKMQTKTIDKLEDLKGYEWEYNEKYFKIAHLKLYVQPAQPEIHGLNLIQINALDFHGNPQDETIRRIGENNLTELEFYGLKVILNGKPKLTNEDSKFLQKLNPENGINKFYITRDLNKTLVMSFEKPKKNTDYQEWNSDGNHILVLSEELFKFITWESGKAWSKAELMELEVVE